MVLSFLPLDMAHCSNTSVSFNQSRAINTLKSAVEKFDELENVPEKAWIRTDKRKLEADINQILDQTIAILDVPCIVDLRQDYRKIEDAIAIEKDHISKLRESRLLAPEGESSITRFIPTQRARQWTATTTGDFDTLIESRQQNLKTYQNEMRSIEIQMSEALSKIGIDLNPEQVEFWLSSVIGDDVLSMSIVFSNAKEVTSLLSRLTKESGENINYAKRYYGMLVMLHKMVINMQERFILKVDDDILPKLLGFSKEADNNIKEAMSLIKSGGSRASLESNISANEITKQAIELYQKIVKDHRKKVSDALKISTHEMRVAINTYNTVRLSSDVMALIREGLDTFETLLSLQIPAADEFQNNEIREEFRKLSERMR
ncbi:hypothetical protein [Desulfonatronum thioautotrophicum]|uniref:hypothetical protein n=1 Tax=Desulfonatronum thioautotrophicum TaxID=617001 RepID=UPI0005EB2667|nr:hypothetical protein [Desulfonatronum thioautotrophicum]